MNQALYGWQVIFQRSGGRVKVTHQPATDVLGAISSALQYNPEFNLASIIEVHQMGEISGCPHK